MIEKLVNNHLEYKRLVEVIEKLDGEALQREVGNL